MTTAEKWTKGPWTCRVRFIGADVMAGNLLIASPVSMINPGEEIANAHLLAASDTMYWALKAMVEAYREGCADGEEPSMVVAALKALATARGEG